MSQTGDPKVGGNTEEAQKAIYTSDGDRAFATYETLDRAKYLPNSLFYEGGRPQNSLDGLFNYYVAGTRDPNKTYTFYMNSETKEYVDSVTSFESRNPTAHQIMQTIMKGDGVNVPPYLDKKSVFRGQPYNVKDFIFCKNYGTIPNNRMITLRRFPHPVEDHLSILNEVEARVSAEVVSLEKSGANDLGIQQFLNGVGQPVAQCVGYFGPGTDNPSLNNILKFNNGLNWQVETQSKKETSQGNDPGIMNSFFGQVSEAVLGSEGTKFLSNVSDLVGSVGNPDKQQFAVQRQFFEKLYSEGGPLSKKIFVDVNTVDKMYRREVGFSGGDETITLKFTYELTSVSTINSRMLFMDLLSNLLQIGTDYGKFLAPEIRHNTALQGINFPGGAKGYTRFLTEPVEYFIDMINGKYDDQMTKLLDAAGKNLKEITKQIGQLSQENLGTFLGGMDKNSFSYKFLENFFRSQAIEKIQFKPMFLSGAPTGSWHLVVGNPLNPIAMMGNLICTGVQIDFGEVLGPDDFPTEMTATYTLKPARQRHRGDYESMFNRGRGRFYLGNLKQEGETKNYLTTADGTKPLSLDSNDPKSTTATLANNNDAQTNSLPE